MPGVYTSIGSDKKFYYVINDAGKLSCGVIDNPKLIDPELTKRLGMGELNEPRFSPNNVLIQRNPLTKILRKIKKTNIISPRERITEI